MARTEITPLVLQPNAGTDPGEATTIDATLVTNGITIPVEGLTFRLLLRVTNSAVAAKNVTVKASPDSYHTHRASVGDLVIPVPENDGERIITGLEAARFVQADGAIYVDLEDGMTGSLRAELTPWPLL